MRKKNGCERKGGACAKYLVLIALATLAFTALVAVSIGTESSNGTFDGNDASDLKCTETEKDTLGAVCRGTCGNGVEFSFNPYRGNTLRISADGTGTGKMDDFEPGKTERPWDSCKQYVENIVVSRGVKKIGDYAFEGMGVKSVRIIGGCYIGEHAFSKCLSLECVDIRGCCDADSNPAAVGKNAFSGCKHLTMLCLRGVDKVGSNAFYGCQIRCVYIDKNVTGIADDAFPHHVFFDEKGNVIFPSDPKFVGKTYCGFKCRLHAVDFKN